MLNVLARDRDGREVLWRCYECGKPFTLGWGDYCNSCIAIQRRHEELLQIINEATEQICANCGRDAKLHPIRSDEGDCWEPK